MGKIMEVKQDIVQMVKLNKLTWYRHTYRMSSVCLPKVIIVWNPKGKHRKSRPKLNWKHSIDETFKNYSLSKDIALNRKR